MADDVARQFIAALGRLESQSDLDTIVSLFVEGAQVGNALMPEHFHGRDGAREFWKRYRDTFSEVRSTFRNVIVGEGHMALEWSTEATDLDGDHVSYDGVSILEIQGPAITRFRAYFDSAKLGRQIAQL